MNRKKLKKIRNRLDKLRQKVSNIRPRELISLAGCLGRKPFPRGKEPTYVSEMLNDKNPISIPNHPGALSKYTAGNILDQLEEDLERLEELLEREEQRKDGKKRTDKK